MPPKDDGGDPKPLVDDPTKPGKDATKELGNGLDVGGYLGTGQKITSENGQYTLQLKDGNIVETGPDDRVLFSSETKDPHQENTSGDPRANDVGKAMGVLFDAEGLALRVNSYYQATTGWQLKADLPEGSKPTRIQLNNDGSIVIIGTDKDGKKDTVLQVVQQPDDKVKHKLVIKLHHPMGDTGEAEGYKKGVLHKTIDAVQEYMQVSVDLMGIGKASKAPDFDELLQEKTGLRDFTDQSAMIDAYSSHLDGIDAAKQELHKLALTKDEATAKVDEHARTAIQTIANIQDDLNAKLRAPGSASDAPQAVKDKPVDITYDKNGDAEAKIPAATVKYLLGALHDAVDQTHTVVAGVAAAADEGKGHIDQNSPEYKAGKKDGYDAGKKDGYSQGKADAEKANPPGSPGDATPPGDPAGDPTAQQTDYSSLFPEDLGADPDPLGLGDDQGNGTDDGTGQNTGGDKDTGDSSTDPFQQAIDKIVAAGTAGTGATNGATGTGQQGFNPANLANMMSPANMMNPANMAGGWAGMGQQLANQFNPMSQYGLPGAMSQNGTGSRTGMSPLGTAVPATANTTSPIRNANGGLVSADPSQSVGAGQAAATAAEPGRLVDMKLAADPTHSQTVPAIVSDAVTKELSNPNGTDVAAAYAGTPAAQTQNWTPIDPSQLKTGDVAQWGDNHTGLVVMRDGHPNIVVNGSMHPLDPEHAPDGGKYHAFFHPAGIDVPQKQSGSQTAQVSADAGSQMRPVRPQAQV